MLLRKKCLWRNPLPHWNEPICRQHVSPQRAPQPLVPYFTPFLTFLACKAGMITVASPQGARRP